jgi:hypothetical protein
MCTDGVGCKRRVCFFAHAESELRKPEDDPVWLQQQMQAEMAAGAAIRRQGVFAVAAQFCKISSHLELQLAF